MTMVIDKPPAKTGGNPTISIMVKLPTPAWREACSHVIYNAVWDALREYDLIAPVRREVTDTEGGVVIEIRDDSVLHEDHPVILHILTLIRDGGSSTSA